MKEYFIAVMVGSLRKGSFNRQLAEALVELAPAGFRFDLLRIDDLPLYNQDDDEHRAPSVLRLKEALERADGLLFVTPEYNRSMPGVLKNAIDQGSRPHGKNSFAGKPAGVLGVSTGNIGTAIAQQHLRNTLAYLDVATMSQPEAFLKAGVVLDEDGGIAAGSREFLQKWMDRYVSWVKKLAG